MLLTSSRSPAGLDLARICASSGFVVFVADSFSVGLCNFSFAVKKVYKVPPPRTKLSQYKEALISIIRDEKIELLIPCYEETFYIAHIQKELSQFCTLFVDSLEKLDCFHNKFSFIKFCKREGFLTPKTYKLSSKNELRNISQIMEGDFVLKPLYSRYGEEVLFSQRDSFEKVSISKEKEWLCQEFLEGKQYSAYGIACKGRVMALAVYPHRESCFHVTLVFLPEQNEEIKEWVSLFVKKSSFTGQISFDFIVTSSGQLYPIECNPRITSGIHLFRDHNPLASFLRGEEVKRLLEPEGGGAQLSLLQVVSFCKGSSPAKGVRDIMFERRDPFPLLGQLFLFCYILLVSLVKRVSLTEASMWDICYNGEKDICI